MKRRVLQVGSRQVVVKTEPLKEGPTFKALALHRAGEQLLVLKAPLWARLIPLQPLLIAALFIYISIAQATWEAAVGAAMFLIVALLLWVELLRRVELDASEHRVRTVWLWKRWERPLEQLLAVQLVKCPSSEKYYLNLVWDDKKDPRENLTGYRDGKAARHAGKELAAFLGIPFLDEAEGKQTEPSRR
jgi:hypothetical protein